MNLAVSQAGQMLGLGFRPGYEVMSHGARTHPPYGGLRRWGSSIPCCLPLVKTSDSKGLARQRMSFSITLEGPHCAGPHFVVLPVPDSGEGQSTELVSSCCAHLNSSNRRHNWLLLL